MSNLRETSAETQLAIVFIPTCFFSLVEKVTPPIKAYGHFGGLFMRVEFRRMARLICGAELEVTAREAWRPPSLCSALIGASGVPSNLTIP